MDESNSVYWISFRFGDLAFGSRRKVSTDYPILVSREEGFHIGFLIVLQFRFQGVYKFCLDSFVLLRRKLFTF